MLRNIRKCEPDEIVRCYCNGGYQDSNYVGTLQSMGLVYYNKNSLANILLLSDVYAKYRVTFDSDIEHEFFVYNTRTGTKKFRKSKSGLHYYDVTSKEKNFTMMQTVDDNKKIFNKKEISLADDAIKLYHAIGRPSYQTYLNMLTNGHIRNCHVTTRDAKNALQIYGIDQGALKGKTVRRTPTPVHTENLYQIPTSIIGKYQDVTLAVNILYLDKIPFFLTVSRHICFHTVHQIDNRLNKTLISCLETVMKLYKTKGLKLTHILSDGEFRHMNNEIITKLQTSLNCTAAGEHVPEAERAIRVIKERVRCIINS